jgi:hypothetical protein
MAAPRFIRGVIARAGPGRYPWCRDMVEAILGATAARRRSNVSWSWNLYSACPVRDAQAIKLALERGLVEYLAEHEECSDTYAEVGIGGKVPTPKAVRAAAAELGDEVPAEILERLKACHTSLVLEDVTDGLDSPLQVSILQFLVTQLAPCLMDWGDFELELGEAVLDKLAPRRSRGALPTGPVPAAVAASPPAVGPSPKPKAPKRAAIRPLQEQGGERRALRLIGLLERARVDRDLAIDLQRGIGRLPPLATDYLELILSDGAMDDARAASELELSLEELQPVLVKIEAALLEDD